MDEWIQFSSVGIQICGEGGVGAGGNVSEMKNVFQFPTPRNLTRRAPSVTAYKHEGGLKLLESVHMNLFFLLATQLGGGRNKFAV
jgi:hypothetical protein